MSSEHTIATTHLLVAVAGVDNELLGGLSTCSFVSTATYGGRIVRSLLSMLFSARKPAASKSGNNCDSSRATQTAMVLAIAPSSPPPPTQTSSRLLPLCSGVSAFSPPIHLFVSDLVYIPLCRALLPFSDSMPS